MRWIKDSEGDYVNLELCKRAYIEDMGLDYTERFRVYVHVDDERVSIKCYRTLLGAQKLLESWFETNEK